MSRGFVPRLPDKRPAFRQGRGRAAPRHVALRPELLRALRAGRPDPLGRGRRAGSWSCPTPSRPPAWPVTSPCTSSATSRRCRRAACSTAPTWRRPRTCSVSGSGRPPRARRGRRRGRRRRRRPPRALHPARPAAAAAAPREGRRDRLRRRARRGLPVWATSAPSRRASAASSPCAAASSTLSLLLDRRPGPGGVLGRHRRALLRRFSVFSQRTVADAGTRLITTAVQVDPTGEAVQAAVSQVSPPPWESAGHDETPDEAYRRAETRALAHLADRFVDLAAVCEERGVRLAQVGPDDVVRSLAGFDGELAAALPGELRERFYLPLFEIRRLLSDAVAVELPAAGAARSVPRCPAAGGRARHHGGRTRPAPPGRRRLPGLRRLSSPRRGQPRRLPHEEPGRHPARAGRAARGRGAASDGSRPSKRRRRPAPAPPRGGRGAAVGGDARAALDPEHRFPVAAPLREGFISSELKLAVIGEHSLLRAAPSGPRFVGGARLTSFFDPRPNDYVVHEDHGIALFSGIETRTVAGVTRDYLFLRFKEEDKLFVPHDQIGKVTRYIGASGAAPGAQPPRGRRLAGRQDARSQGGGRDGRRAAHPLRGPPGRARSRLRRRRRAHPPPRRRLRLRGGRDQAEAIVEVNTYIEDVQPMDRLICGDVGYGKTEVAMRAALQGVRWPEAGRRGRPDDRARRAAF